MIFINLVVVFAISFFGMNLFNAYKAWKLSKQYNYFFKGMIDNVRLEGNKIFFKVKWGLPTNLNKTDSMNKSGVQFYDHYVETIPNKYVEAQKQVFFNKITQKYIDKSFNLQAKIIDNTLVDIRPFTGNIQNIILNIIGLSISVLLFVYKSNIIAHINKFI